MESTGTLIDTIVADNLEVRVYRGISERYWAFAHKDGRRKRVIAYSGVWHKASLAIVKALTSPATSVEK